MKINLSIFCAFAAVSASAHASSLILSDNFNAPDNGNFDSSDQTGRRAGTPGAGVQLRSSMFQHAISNNQLLMGVGRVRFHDSADLNTWHNFAGGAAGLAILGERGMRVEFDWIPVNTTDDNWVSFNVGISGQGAGEPGTRVNDPATDFGMLFRNNGGTQFFDNGAATIGGTFTASAASRHVVIDYRFSSFADGSNVAVTASVDGSAPLFNQNFQWDGNAGSLYMELGSLSAGTRIDNFTLTAVPEPSALAFAGLAGLLGLSRRRRK